MVRFYSLSMRIIIWVIILSIIKVDKIIIRSIDYYSIAVFRSLVTELTKLNWSYGFFTADSNDYQYLKYNIILVDEKNSKKLEITKNGQLGNLGARINAIRLNTCIQQIVRDSMLLEAGSRSIALYFFNKYTDYRNIDFSIQAHNFSLQTKNNRFLIESKIDTIFNKRLSY